MNMPFFPRRSSQCGSTRTISLVLLALIILLAGFAFLSHRGVAPKTEHIVINQAANTLLYLPLYIANDNGYFKDQDVDVSIVTGGGDSQAFAAVIGGSADIAQGDPMMVPISRQEGGPGKIIGNVVGRVAFWGVAVDPKITPITKPQDFAGKRVVTYPAPNTIYALQQRALLAGGLTLGKDSFIIQAQFGTELAPLFAGKADITMTLEPVVSQALAKGAHIVYSFPEQYGDYPLTGLMVKEDLIQKNPGLVQHVLNAYQEALTYAYQNPDGAIAVAVKEFPDVDKTIIANAVRRMLSEGTIPKVVTVSQDAYEKAISVRRDIGDLQKDVSFGDAVDNQFAEKAVLNYGPK
jgi:NitT/TauT family transport system substrate-binding protein